MAQDQVENQEEEDVGRESEPGRMSWFVFAFMSMCLFMTAVMAYYAWGVFQSSV